MKKFIISETITQTTTTEYEVEAENEEQALEAFKLGQYNVLGDYASNDPDGIVVVEKLELT